MKDSTSIYTEEKTIFIRTSTAAVSSNYPDSKTSPVRFDQFANIPYPEQKTIQIIFKAAPAIEVAPVINPVTSFPVSKPGETGSSLYASNKTSQVIFQIAENFLQNYPSLKTIPVIFKTALATPPVSGLNSTPLPEVIGRNEKSDNYPSRRTIAIIFKPITGSTGQPDVESAKRVIANYAPDKTVPVTEKLPGVQLANAGTLSGPEVVIMKKEKRQPVLFFLILSVILFLSTGVLGWMYWQEHKRYIGDHQKLQEITGTKVDDIVGGGLTSNAEFALTTDQLASAKFIRVCFSISENFYAAKGEKIFSVRLIDPQNKVVGSVQKNMVNSDGDFSFEKKINYAGQELFICEDIEKSEKFSAGHYKIEIYSEDLLKGVGSFELK